MCRWTLVEKQLGVGLIISGLMDGVFRFRTKKQDDKMRDQTNKLNLTREIEFSDAKITLSLPGDSR